MTKAELVKSIKASRLYKEYHNPTNEISREKTDGVNASGQATDRMMGLQRMIKQATMRETDFPPELRNDADELRELIQTGIVTLFADADDGTISNADFQQVFGPLAGMTEGMMTALHYDDPDKMMSLRHMRNECADKAFYRQFKRTLHESSIGANHGRERLFAFGKALSSFGTHLFIRAEKGGHLPTGLVEEVNELVSKLNAKAARGVFEFADEVSTMRGWGLIEGKKGNKGMAPATAGSTPANKSKVLTGLAKKDKKVDTTTPGQPEGDDRWRGDKKGKGLASEVSPPQLVQDPGNPQNMKPADGPEPKQDGKWMDGGNSNTIDGVASNKPKKEAVEFLSRIPKKHANHEWNILHKGKRIGEAFRHVVLGGGECRAMIGAEVIFEKLIEDTRTIEVRAPDIFALQVKVVEALNKLASELKVERRFTIAR